LFYFIFFKEKNEAKDKWMDSSIEENEKINPLSVRNFIFDA